jgi:menaquinone-dependent protoporphyrinogen oxidase
MTRVLIAYATKYGATQEIAEAIGAGLLEAGAEVDVRPAKEVHAPGNYEAVAVGSGVYMGRWHGDGLDFLKRFERELRERPTWLFSDGPTGGDPKAEAKVAEFLAAPPPAPGDVAKRATEIHIRGHQWFGGRVTDATAKSAGLFARFVPRADNPDPAAARQFGAAIGAVVAGQAQPVG